MIGLLIIGMVLFIIVDLVTFNIKKSSFTSQLLFNNQYLYEGTEKNIYGDIPNLIFSDLYNISIKRLTNPNRILIKYIPSNTLSPLSNIIQSFNPNHYSIEGLYKIVDSNTDYDNKLLKLLIIIVFGELGN